MGGATKAAAVAGVAAAVSPVAEAVHVVALPDWLAPAGFGLVVALVSWLARRSITELDEAVRTLRADVQALRDRALKAEGRLDAADQRCADRCGRRTP